MKLPVFPNCYPFNEMFFDGHLQIGDFAVKTRSWAWKYRGLVLFYTSGRIDHQAIDAYGYERHPSKHKVIIGVANLVEVRPLTNIEARKMVLNFNNWSPQHLKALLKVSDLPYSQDLEFWSERIGDFWGERSVLIRPFSIGFFFKNATRLDRPVPFNWPAGPVRPITIQTARYPKLHAELLLAHHS